MESFFENKTMTGFLAMAVIAFGFGFPSVLVYLNVFHGLDIWFVGFFTLLSLAAGFSLPAIVMENARPEKKMELDTREIERFREAQIDLLKDMDEMIDYLNDIENMLRVEE